MNEWHRALRSAANGVQRPDRTGVGTKSVFGMQLSMPNTERTFPAVTTKRLAFKQVAAELACFLRGYDNLEDFHKLGCHIWDGNGAITSGSRFKPSKPGDLGRIYGVQWRDWHSPDLGRVVFGSSEASPTHPSKHTDQLRNLVAGLKLDPFSRRHMVTAWNPGELDDVCLPPCHVLFQCYVYRPHNGQGELWLDLRVDMRSVDLFLGLPFDIASYALLQRLLCKEVGMASGHLVFQLGDAHIYNNHEAQVAEVLSRDPEPPPLLRLRDDASLFEFHPDQAWLEDYLPHPAIPAPLNV